MEIVLIRGAGDSYEEVLENPLASDLLSKRQLGRNFLDDHATPISDVEVKVLYRDGIQRGDVITLEHALTGETWIVKITGVKHDVSPSTNGGGLDTTITCTMPEQDNG